MARHPKSGHDKSKPSMQGAGGKVENDHNKSGAQPATQKNEAQRTPLSRSDRESKVGSDNQVRARMGGPGAPMGGKSR